MLSWRPLVTSEETCSKWLLGPPGSRTRDTDGIPHVGWRCTIGGWEWETLLGNSRKLRFSATPLPHHQSSSFSFTVYEFSKVTISIFNLKVFVILTFCGVSFVCISFMSTSNIAEDTLLRTLLLLTETYRGMASLEDMSWTQTFEECSLLPTLSWLCLLPARCKVNSFMVYIQPLLRSQMTKPAKYELKALNP